MNTSKEQVILGADEEKAIDSKNTENSMIELRNKIKVAEKMDSESDVLKYENELHLLENKEILNETNKSLKQLISQAKALEKEKKDSSAIEMEIYRLESEKLALEKEIVSRYADVSLNKIIDGAGSQTKLEDSLSDKVSNPEFATAANKINVEKKEVISEAVKEIGSEVDEFKEVGYLVKGKARIEQERQFVKNTGKDLSGNVVKNTIAFDDELTKREDGLKNQAKNKGLDYDKLDDKSYVVTEKNRIIESDQKIRDKETPVSSENNKPGSWSWTVNIPVHKKINSDQEHKEVPIQNDVVKEEEPVLVEKENREKWIPTEGERLFVKRTGGQIEGDWTISRVERNYVVVEQTDPRTRRALVVKELPITDLEKINDKNNIDFLEVENINDLYKLIKFQGGLEGSNQNYSPELLIEIVGRVMNREIGLEKVTKKNNLRFAVEKLLEKNESIQEHEETPVAQTGNLEEDLSSKNIDVLSKNNLFHVDRLICPNNINQDDVVAKLTEEFIEGGKKLPDEKEKDSEELDIINKANEIANKYAQSYGVLKPFNIPLENIHILSGGMKADGDWSQGDCSIRVKKINTNERTDKKTDFARTIFHELIHSKSYNVVKAELKDEKLNLINHSSGIGINLKRKDGNGYQTNHLFSLNEAITEMLTEKFFNECKENGIFSSEDIADYEKRGGGAAYPSERLEFTGILRKIYENNKNSYAAITESEAINNIRDEFIKAYFSGKFMNLGRLVEKTFGPGSLKQINEGGFSKDGLGWDDYRDKFMSQDLSSDSLN